MLGAERPVPDRSARRSPTRRLAAGHRVRAATSAAAAISCERDLDALEAAAGDYVGPLKLQVAGPWTLAASLELTRGDKALADPGAVRDIAESLADGTGGPRRGCAAPRSWGERHRGLRRAVCCPRCWLGHAADGQRVQHAASSRGLGSGAAAGRGAEAASARRRGCTAAPSDPPIDVCSHGRAPRSSASTSPCPPTRTMWVRRSRRGLGHHRRPGAHHGGASDPVRDFVGRPPYGRAGPFALAAAGPGSREAPGGGGESDVRPGWREPARGAGGDEAAAARQGGRLAEGEL